MPSTTECQVLRRRSENAIGGAMTGKGDDRLNDTPSNETEAGTDDKPLHLRLSPAEVAELDTIVGWMKSDPQLGRLKLRIGREKAVRYAIGRCLAHPPEHAKGG